MSGNGFIEIKDLTKVYAFGTVEVAALRGVTLSIDRDGLLA